MDPLLEVESDFKSSKSLSSSSYISNGSLPFINFEMVDATISRKDESEFPSINKTEAIIVKKVSANTKGANTCPSKVSTSSLSLKGEEKTERLAEIEESIKAWKKSTEYARLSDNCRAQVE